MATSFRNELLWGSCVHVEYGAGNNDEQREGNPNHEELSLGNVWFHWKTKSLLVLFLCHMRVIFCGQAIENFDILTNKEKNSRNR